MLFRAYRSLKRFYIRAAQFSNCKHVAMAADVIIGSGTTIFHCRDCKTTMHTAFPISREAVDIVAVAQGIMANDDGTYAPEEK